MGDEDLLQIKREVAEDQFDPVPRLRLLRALERAGRYQDLSKASFDAVESCPLDRDVVKAFHTIQSYAVLVVEDIPKRSGIHRFVSIIGPDGVKATHCLGIERPARHYPRGIRPLRQ